MFCQVLFFFGLSLVYSKLLFRLEGVRGSEPPSCCPAANSFWLVVLSIQPCKTGNPSTPWFLSKAGPEGLLSKKIGIPTELVLGPKSLFGLVRPLGRGLPNLVTGY
jgi:hypothetical protein